MDKGLVDDLRLMVLATILGSGRELLGQTGAPDAAARLGHTARAPTYDTLVALGRKFGSMRRAVP